MAALCVQSQVAPSPSERAAQPRGSRAALVTGVLLCGGASRRMGADKACATLGGRALIAYPLAVLASVAGRVVLASGARARYPELGCECVLDAFADAGPLAGLLAGLEAARTEWVAVLACDMPSAQARVLEELLAQAAAREVDVGLLALPRGTQPCFAVYRRRRCASAVRAALEAGERRMDAFYTRAVDGAALRVLALDARTLGAGAGDCATNVNTPRELEDERARLEAREKDRQR